MTYTLSVKFNFLNEVFSMVEMSEEKILNLIAQTIYDKKGINILALNIKSISSLTDYAIIAEGTVDKHVIAIARAVQDALFEMGIKPIFVEGTKNGDWVVLDYLHIMVHLFMPGLRDKYQLEQLWREGEIVDLKIDVSSPKSNTYT
jgi:ribosome-associated protein